MTRSRDRSFTATSPPSSIARRIAFSDSWHAEATSWIVSSLVSARGSGAEAAPIGTRSDEAGSDVQVVCGALNSVLDQCGGNQNKYVAGVR